MGELEKTLQLLNTSAIHKKYNISDINRLVIPPLKLNQYRIYGEEGFPRCYLSWAYFSPDINQKYVTENYKLQEDDWNSGDILWLINVISPYSQAIKYTLRLDKERREASKGKKVLGFTTDKNLNNIFFRRINKENSSKKIFKVAKRFSNDK